MREKRRTVSGVKTFTCSGIDTLMNLLMDASVHIKSDDGNCPCPKCNRKLPNGNYQWTRDANGKLLQWYPEDSEEGHYAEATFKSGDEVEALWTDGQWYDTTILARNPDGTYKIHWVDYGHYTTDAHSAYDLRHKSVKDCPKCDSRRFVRMLNIVPWITGIQVTRYTPLDNRRWAAQSMLGQDVHVDAVQRILDHPHTPETHEPEILRMTPGEERAWKLTTLRDYSDTPVLQAGVALKRLLLTQATDVEVKPLLAITGPESLAMIREITKARSLCKGGTCPREYPVLTLDLEDTHQDDLITGRSITRTRTISRARPDLLED